MKSKAIHSFILCLILTVGYFSPVQAVTDAELEALEKQIEQLEAEEKKKTEAAAKLKADQKRKANAEAEKKRLAELEKKRQEEKRMVEEEKRKVEEARLAALEQQRQEAARRKVEEEKITGELMDIPAGSFRMGEITGEGDRDEKLVHTVTISSFRMGKHEVTFEQWDACVTDGGCNGYRPKDDKMGRHKRPVIYVSWDDTQSFINWLNRKTSGGYRLPSEAEWEYAARAGTETKYPWGNDIGRNHANCNGCGSQWDNKITAPVGSFSANAFGLHDMHGNVIEWVQDCWHDSYDGAPSDGSVWIGGKCDRHVGRGGSYIYHPDYVRSAHRAGGKSYMTYRTGSRVFVIGFRLAQNK